LAFVEQRLFQRMDKNDVACWKAVEWSQEESRPVREQRPGDVDHGRCVDAALRGRDRLAVRAGMVSLGSGGDFNVVAGAGARILIAGTGNVDATGSWSQLLLAIRVP
jgi:hypothetical protein